MVGGAHLIPVGLIGLLRESGHPEDLGGFQEATERALMDVHFAVVDELHQGVQIAKCYILQYYHRVLARCALKSERFVKFTRADDRPVIFPNLRCFERP